MPVNCDKRREHVLALHPGRVVRRNALRREFDEVECGAGHLRGAEIVAGQVHDRVQHVRIDGDPGDRRQPGGDVAGEPVDLDVAQRWKPHELEGAADGRPALQKGCQPCRCGFAQHDDPSRGDGRQHLIEQGCGRSRVRAAGRELQEVRDVPEHPLFDGELGGEAVEPLFELPEVLLSGHQARRTGLEDGPALCGRSHRQQDQKARLSRTGFADDEYRPEWGVQDGILGRRELLFDARVLEQQLLAGVRFDEPAERL